MKNNKKGFTLAELLIVIAIMAILIAIAIPVFSAQLEKARHAVDMSTARSAKSLAEAHYLLEHANLTTGTEVTFTFAEDDDGNIGIETCSACGGSLVKTVTGDVIEKGKCSACTGNLGVSITDSKAQITGWTITPAA